MTSISARQAAATRRKLQAKRQARKEASTASFRDEFIAEVLATTQEDS